VGRTLALIQKRQPEVAAIFLVLLKCFFGFSNLTALVPLPIVSMLAALL
jgi:hypothetical protein